VSEECELDNHDFTFYHNIFEPIVVVITLHLLQNQGTLRIILLVVMSIKKKYGTHSSSALCSYIGICTYTVMENTLQS
jgi:hypothetical protein